MARRNVFTVQLNDSDKTKWRFINPVTSTLKEYGGGLYVIETAEGNAYTFPTRSVLYTQSLWEDVPDE